MILTHCRGMAAVVGRSDGRDEIGGDRQLRLTAMARTAITHRVFPPSESRRQNLQRFHLSHDSSRSEPCLQLLLPQSLPGRCRRRRLVGPRQGGDGARHPHPRGGGGQPAVGDGERRAAFHRRVFRRLANATRPGGRGLFARPGLLGAVARRAGRPLRPQDDGAAGRVAGDPRRADQRLCADDPGLDLRTSLRRFCRRHGLSDHPLLDCGIVGGGAVHARVRSRYGLPSAARSRCPARCSPA